MKKVILILSCLFFLAVTPLNAQAQATATLSINPATMNLKAGETAILGVMVANIQDLYAYDITLKYDSAVIKVTSIESGSFLDTGFTAAQVIDDGAGSAQIAFSQLPPSGGKTGSGELVVIRIKALAAGTTSIKIETAQLLKKDASAITVTTSTGSVTVTGGTTSSGSQPASSVGDQPENSGNQPIAAPTNTPQPDQKETPAEVVEEQPAEDVQPATTEAPARQPAEQPETSGSPSLAWLIPVAILLMAGGYFGGNLLRKLTKKKKKKK